MNLQAQVQVLADQFRRNPRLQMGGAMILLLVLGWLLLVLGDVRQQQAGELEEAHSRLHQIRELAQQKAWAERAEEAEALAASLEAEIPPAASPGMAQAAFQSWLRALVDSQNADLRLDIQEQVRMDQPADIVRVSATISGSLSPDRVVQLMGRIESRTELSIIPLATIRSDGNQAFSITVQGFYRVPLQEPAP